MNSSNEVTENTNIVSSIQNELTSQQKVFNKIIFWFVFLLPLFIWIVLLYLAPKIENNDFLSFVRDYSNNVITGYTLAIITTILLKFFEKEEISKDFIYLSIFFYIILAIGLIVSYSTNNNLKIFDRSEHNSELWAMYKDLNSARDSLKEISDGISALHRKIDETQLINSGLKPSQVTNQ